MNTPKILCGYRGNYVPSALPFDIAQLRKPKHATRVRPPRPQRPCKTCRTMFVPARPTQDYCNRVCAGVGRRGGA